MKLANRLNENPEPQALSGKVLALLFLSPSLRTLASFQAAMTRLGGGAFVISPDMSIHGLETRPGIVMDGVAAEHIREAVPVIASYGDAIGIRAFAERKDLQIWSRRRLIPVKTWPIGKRLTIWAYQQTVENLCSAGRFILKLCRSQFRHQRCKWPLNAAWTLRC